MKTKLALIGTVALGCLWLGCSSTRTQELPAKPQPISLLSKPVPVPPVPVPAPTNAAPSRTDRHEWNALSTEQRQIRQMGINIGTSLAAQLIWEDRFEKLTNSGQIVTATWKEFERRVIASAPTPMATPPATTANRWTTNS